MLFGRRKSEDPAVAEVEVADAAAFHRAGAVLLDVRGRDEWLAGHAPNAVHVPVDRVAGIAARLQGRRVLAVCRSGSRSAQAVTVLREAGVDVRNVAGGMTAWEAAGLPVVRDDGTAGVVA